MLVSSSSTLGIKTCLYKSFLTAEGTKCSPARKKKGLLHLPPPWAAGKQWLPKGLAAGLWQVVHTVPQLAQRRKTKLQLSGVVRLFCLVPLERKGTATSTSQAQALDVMDLFSPCAVPTLVPVAPAWVCSKEGRLRDTQLLPCPLSSRFILSMSFCLGCCACSNFFYGRRAQDLVCRQERLVVHILILPLGAPQRN